MKVCEKKRESLLPLEIDRVLETILWSMLLIKIQLENLYQNNQFIYVYCPVQGTVGLCGEELEEDGTPNAASLSEHIQKVLGLIRFMRRC